MWMISLKTCFTFALLVQDEVQPFVIQQEVHQKIWPRNTLNRLPHYSREIFDFIIKGTSSGDIADGNSAKESSDDEASSNDKNERRGGGYQFGDISRAIGRKITGQKEYKFGDLTKRVVKATTGNENYEFGDITKGVVRSATGNDDYEFGDLSRWVDSQIKEKINSYTGQENYTFGDITNEVSRRIRSGEYTWEELMLLFKILLSFGMGLTPVAQLIPTKLLVEMINVSILQDVGERLTSALSLEMDRRMKQALLGNSNYQFGDITRSAINNFTGKDEYQFGDITRAVLDENNQKKGKNEKKLLKVNDMETTSSVRDSISSARTIGSDLEQELNGIDRIIGIEAGDNEKRS